jgi:hypothetical protein
MGKGNGGLGEEWRVMVVMTLLVILEERRITGASSAGRCKRCLLLLVLDE